MNYMTGKLPTDAQPIYDLVQRMLPADVFGESEVFLMLNSWIRVYPDVFIYFLKHESVIGDPFYPESWEHLIKQLNILRTLNGLPGEVARKDGE